MRTQIRTKNKEEREALVKILTANGYTVRITQVQGKTKKIDVVEFWEE
jgi:hypothetical protein